MKKNFFLLGRWISGIIICEEEYYVQILTQTLKTQPKSKPGSETREKNPGVKC